MLNQLISNGTKTECKTENFYFKTRSRSVSPSSSPSPRQSIVRPQALPVQRTRGITFQGPTVQNPNTLHPLGVYINFLILF